MPLTVPSQTGQNLLLQRRPPELSRAWREDSPQPLGPFLVVAGAWFLVLLGANLATPLYAMYAQLFRFSSMTLTLIFGIYALSLIPALLVFGQLSDHLGRKRVIVAGLTLAMIGLLVFALARSQAWLFAARAVQGLAVGVVSGAAGAALVELEPQRDRRRAALLAALALAGGSAAGPVVAGAMAQWTPWPRTLCYLVILVATAIAALAVLTLHYQAPAKSAQWRVQRPTVPVEIRSRFCRVSLTASVAWSIAALFLSVLPSYASELLISHNFALLAAISAAMLASSCITQFISQRMPARKASEAEGLALLAAGMVALVLAHPEHSLVLLAASAVLAGVGHGLAFLGAQGNLNHLVADKQRGQVTAAFYTCIYLGVAIPVIGIGLLTLTFSLFAAICAFAIVAGGSALLLAAWRLRARRSETQLVVPEEAYMQARLEFAGHRWPDDES